MKNQELIARLQQMPLDAEVYVEMIDDSAIVHAADHIQVGEEPDAPQVIVLHTPHFHAFCRKTGWCE